MATTTRQSLTGDEIVALSRKHTLFEWTAQGSVDPIPVARAKGVYFWTPEGKRFLDFNSQLMCVNIGHGDARVVRAIEEQARLVEYVTPSLTTEPRARLGAKLATIAPGDIDVFFFHKRRSRGQRERVQNRARLHRPAEDPVALSLVSRRDRRCDCGDRRTTCAGARPPLPGFVHVLNPYHGIARGWDTTEQALRQLEEIVQLEGPQTIAALIVEPVTGTNGILVPPDGYLQGLRALCDRHGILLIADEVMSGFGRTGTWFAVDHWQVVPDMLTMAKGLTSAYVQLGAVGLRQKIADHFSEVPFPGGLTYGSHPVACAAALATLEVIGGRSAWWVGRAKPAGSWQASSQISQVVTSQ